MALHARDGLKLPTLNAAGIDVRLMCDFWQEFQVVFNQLIIHHTSRVGCLQVVRVHLPRLATLLAHHPLLP